MTEYRDCDIPNDDEELAPEKITVSPATLAFEDTYVWKDSQYQLVTITNSGTVDWFFADIILSGEFSMPTVSIPNGLKAGKSITVRLVFSPTKVGTATGTLELKTLRGASAKVTLAGKALERPVESSGSGEGSGGTGGEGGGGTTVVTQGLNNWNEGTTGTCSTLIPKAGSSNVTAVIRPKGTGALAGNTLGVRGQYAVDFQFNNLKANTTAGGNYSAILSGRNNTTAGTYSFIGSGYTNTAEENKSVIITGTENIVAGERSSLISGDRNQIEGTDNSVLASTNTTINGTGNILGYSYTGNIEGNYNSILTGLNNTFNGNNNILLTGNGNNIKGSNNIIGRAESLSSTISNAIILYSTGLTLNSTNTSLVINRALNTTINSSSNIYLGSVTSANINKATNGVILLGSNNNISSINDTIISGSSNTITGSDSTIISGSGNSISSGSNNIILQGSDNYLSSCSNVTLSGTGVTIFNVSNAVILNNSNTTVSGSGSYNNLVILGTSNGSINESSTVTLINSSGCTIESSDGVHILGGRDHYINSSYSVLCLQGIGNTSDSSENSVFLGGYKNKFTEAAQAIALGGSRNVHMAQGSMSLGGSWGHDLMTSNHIFRASKEGVDYKASKANDATGADTGENPGNNLADWMNTNGIYQVGSVLLQSMPETSKGMYEGTQEYKRYLLTHSLRYLSNNVWNDLPNVNPNNTLIIPVDSVIFWELKAQFYDFTNKQAFTVVCSNGIIMNNSEGISVIKKHESTLTPSTSGSIPQGEISVETDTENSRIYFCIPVAWKNFIGGAELSYRLITNKEQDFYWD